ncbi:MAG: hypothetical protein HYV96_06970 [Opitutae bacterium]|nr:hypothetical protein [Opitutae bacterium]
MRPAPEEAPDAADRRTGLPLLRTWRAVYWCVLAVFALWVALLTWLTRHFA